MHCVEAFTCQQKADVLLAKGRKQEVGVPVERGTLGDSHTEDLPWSLRKLDETEER